MSRLLRLPLGQLQHGDEIFEIARGRRRGERLGVVESATKRKEKRDVMVRFIGGGGFTQNWSAHVFVRREQPAPVCGVMFADPLGNACRCTREPHESWEAHRGEVVTSAEESA